MRLLVLASFCVLCCSAAASFQPLSQVMAATPHYDLAITLLPDAHRMEVKGTLLLPPREQEQQSIVVKLSALMKDFQVEIVEPAECAGPASLSESADKDPNGRSTLWLLKPTRSIAAHKPVRIRFSCQGGRQSFVFYLGPEGSFAGGSNTAWYPQFGDNSRGMGRLAFQVPAGITVLATGKHLANAGEEARGHFEFENSVPSQFSFAAGKYQVFQRDGIVPLRAYLLHPRDNVNAYLDGCSRVLAVLSKKFGRYPFAEFAIAEVPSDQAHQTGFSGASMNGFMLADKEALDHSFNLAYYGHEIGHQWWGNLVTNGGSTGDDMLDEALAQFGSLHVVETVAGTTAAEEYRTSGYPGYSSEQCGYEYLRTAEAGDDQPLGMLTGNKAHWMADSKGFLVWEMLARAIGPERFDEALRKVARDFAFQPIAWETFLSIVQQSAGKDLRWFYTQWFERTGAPNWQLTWNQQGAAVRGEITQAAPFYQAEIEVEIVGVNGERASHAMAVAGGRTEFRWPVAFHVRSVTLDPHFYVLHWLPALRGEALARGPALRANALCDSGKLDDAEQVLRKAIETAPKPDIYGEYFWNEQALARIAIQRKNWTEAQLHLEAALQAPVRDAKRLPMVYYAYAKVAQAQKNEAKLQWAIQLALEADALVPDGTAAPYLIRALVGGGKGVSR